jgi:carbonic anhydrase
MRQDVIVCGHYNCGGVIASVDGNKNFDFIQNWIRGINHVYRRNEEDLTKLPRDEAMRRLCEMNVINQVGNVCQTTFMQKYWASGKKCNIHGWIYGIEDGLVKDLSVSVSSVEEWQSHREKYSKVMN